MTGGLAGAGGAPGAAVAGAPPQMPNVGMPALAPHVMPAQTTFASAFASSADPSAAAAGLADPYAQPQAKKQRSEPNGGAGAGMIGMPLLYDGAQGGTTTSTSTAAELSQIKSLMSMLIEQVREVKRENASLRDELTQLTTHRVRALEDDNRRLHAELLRLRSVVDDLQSLRNNHQPPNSQLQLYLNPAFITSSSPSPPSPSSFFNPSLSLSSSSLLSPSFLSSSDLGPLSARGAGGGWAPNRGGRPTWAGLLGMPAFRPLAKRALPFLDDYAGELATRPCVFDDVFNDIYAVFDMREPADPQELCVNSPIFTYASPGYCAVTGYEMEELVGKPIQTISRTDKETLFIVLVNIFAKPPSPVGDLWATVQTWQHKNGTPLMLRLRHQLFYNQLWQPKWLVLVTESVLESPHLQPQNDILHTPDEFQRFRTRFPAFFDSLFTTSTRTARLKAAGSTTTSLGRPLSASFGVEQWFTAPLPSGGVTGATIRELDDDSADTPPPQAVAPAEVTGDYQLGDILSILDSPRAPFSPFST